MKEEQVWSLMEIVVKMLRRDEWQTEAELVLKEEKIYILKNEELRVEIIWLYHDIPATVYKGRQNMMQLVTRNYLQPEVMRDIKQMDKQST